LSSSKNPVEHKLLHIWFFSFHMCCNICHDPNLGLATKAKAWKSAGQECNLKITFALPRVWVRVWGNEPTHSQMDSHFGSWNPYGAPNFQRVIWRVKTHWIKKKIMPLESSWNENAWNGLTWPIWVLKTQVMAKRKVKGQSANLTPNH
jgi:hypothetical protein